MVATKTNPWREHVKKTMALMKASAKGGKGDVKGCIKASR